MGALSSTHLPHSFSKKHVNPNKSKHRIGTPPNKENMDFVKNAIGGGGSEEQKKEGESNESGGGFMDKINTMAGGGKASEKDEDALDKGIDAFQQYGMGQGPQNNESAVEQAKDEAISDYIRGQYQDATGSKMPIEDK